MIACVYILVFCNFFMTLKKVFDFYMFYFIAGGKDEETFNPAFLTAWKATHNYKMWSSSKHLGVLEVNPG